MSSFRRYGGLNYSSTNNYTKSYISNSNKLNFTNSSGQPNSKGTFSSHVDLSGNSLLHTGTVYFQDGTSMNTAPSQGSQGATGAQGSQGVTGAQGPTGTQGSIGTQGPIGAQGPSGTNYWAAGINGINYNGYVGIGTNNPTANLYVAGSIVATSTIRSGSDYRIKKDIKSFGLEDYSVDNLNPVYFKFKTDEKESIGLIAHELQEYYPFLVEGEKDGKNTQSVNYIGLIAVLIKEIQELKKRVVYLETNKIE